MQEQLLILDEGEFHELGRLFDVARGDGVEQPVIGALIVRDPGRCQVTAIHSGAKALPPGVDDEVVAGDEQRVPGALGNAPVKFLFQPGKGGNRLQMVFNKDPSP